MLADIANLKLWKTKFARNTEDKDSEGGRYIHIYKQYTQTDLCVFHKTSNTTYGNSRGRNNKADSNHDNWRPS